MTPRLISFTRSLALAAAAGLGILCFSGCSSSSRVAAGLTRAERDYAAGHYDQAEIEYKNVLQLDGRNATAIARLGLILHEEGRSARAFPFLLKTKELQPDNLEARLRLGLTYLADGRAAEARDEALFVLERQPADSQAPLLLVEATGLKADEIAEARQRLLRLPRGAPVLVAIGALALREGKVADAESSFRDAGAADADSPDVALAVGMLRWAQRDLPAADASLARAAALSADRSPRRLKYAQFKIQTGDPLAGKKLLEAMSLKTPDYLPVWVWLAEVAAAEKDFAESSRLLVHVFTRDPLHPDAMMLDARLHLAKGEVAPAIVGLERLITLFPNSPLIAYQLGMAYEAGGDHAMASKRLAQAITASPGMSHAILAQAEINIGRGDFSAAVIPLQRLLQSRPDLPLARAVLAEAYRGLGRLDEAATLYRSLVEQFPQDPQPRFWLGLVQRQQNRPDEARESLTQALALAPADQATLEQLTELDLRAKKFGDAHKRLAKAIASNPQRGQLLLLVARVQLAEGNPAAAEGSLKSAVELAPESPAPLLALGRLQAGRGQSESALATLRLLAGRFPKLGGVSSMIGVIHDGLGRYPEARRAYEEALAVDPRDAIALNNLAYLYAERFNQLDQSLELAERAHALAPADPRAADTLGWILSRRKQYGSALSLLQESAARMPDEAEVHFHLGATLYSLGDEAAARAALQRALTLNVGLPVADEARQRLRILDLVPEEIGDEERRSLAQRIAAQPDDPVAQIRLADSYRHAGETDKALAGYQATLLANPKSARAQIAIAQIWAGRKEFAKALDAARQARALAPADAEIARTLGRLAFQAGNHRWAASLLQTVAQQRPEDPEAQFDWSSAAYSVGRVAEAQKAARAALTLAPAFPRAPQAEQFLALLALAENAGLARSGLLQARRALESDPASVPALMVMAIAEDQPSGSVAAQHFYARILELYPDFSPAQRNLLISYSTKPANDLKAVALATDARLAFPHDPELARAIGFIAYRRGEFARAASLLEEAATQLGKDGELTYHVGMARWRLNQRREGRLLLQQALDLGLNDTQAAEARRHLASLD